MLKRGICDLCPQPRGEFIAYLRALATYSSLLQKHIAYHFPIPCNILNNIHLLKIF